MSQSLKPNRQAFVPFSWLLSAATLLLLLLLVYLASRVLYRGAIHPSIFSGIGIIAAVALSFSWVRLTYSYQKSEFLFKDDRLIVRGGGIFSSFEQELIAKNITHVICKKPFLEHQLHQTGHIYIQAAGGADVEVHMRSIDAPDSVYNQVLDMLRRNGFALTCEKEVYREQPAKRGVMLQTLAFAGIGALVSFGFIAGILEDKAKGELKLFVGWEAFAFLTLVVVAAITSLIYFHGLMSRRRYTLYDDAITSKTNFFTVMETLIPMENLSDSTLTQSLIGRWIKLSDLSLSCQGSGHEIKFDFVENGQHWKDLLDELIRERAQRKKEAKKTAGSASSGASVKDWQHPKRPVIKRDDTFATSLEISRKRLLLVPVLSFMAGLALLFLGVVLLQGIGQLQKGEQLSPSQVFGMVMLGLGGVTLLGSVLRLLYGFVFVRANSFEIKPTGFAKYFHFIVTKDVVFQAEKVTAVLVKEGLMDRMFGTCSVEFWSIGASDHLRYRYIFKEEDTLQMILAKVGIHRKIGANLDDEGRPKDGAKYREVLAQADPLRVMQMLMFVMVPLLFSIPLLWLFVHPLAAAGVFLLILAPIVGANIYYRFHKLTLYEDYLWFRKGVIKHTHYYVLYEDVKYVQTNVYPMTSAGTLTFEITGERIVKTNNGEIKLSNRFHVRFVSDVRYHHLFLDLLFARELDWEKLPQSPTAMESYQPREIASSAPKMSQELFVRGISIVVGLLIIGGGSILMVLQARQANVSSIGFYIIAGMSLLSMIQFVFIVLYVRSIRYILDEQKVSKMWGIFFKSKMGIHYEDIDYIGKKYGLIHKMFGSGNITVNTVGSSNTDLTLSNLPDTEQFYKLLKERYQGGTEEDK